MKHHRKVPLRALHSVTWRCVNEYRATLDVLNVFELKNGEIFSEPETSPPFVTVIHMLLKTCVINILWLSGWKRLIKPSQTTFSIKLISGEFWLTLIEDFDKGHSSCHVILKIIWTNVFGYLDKIIRMASVREVICWCFWVTFSTSIMQ